MIGSFDEPLSDSEWREWLRNANDDELRQMVRDFRNKAASDCEAELDRRAEAAYDRSAEAYYRRPSSSSRRWAVYANPRAVLWARSCLARFWRHNKFGELEFLGFAGWERYDAAGKAGRAYQALLAMAMSPINGTRLWETRRG